MGNHGDKRSPFSSTAGQHVRRSGPTCVRGLPNWCSKTVAAGPHGPLSLHTARTVRCSFPEGTIMKNPRRDGGLLDKAMPYVGLITSVYLLVQGLRLYRSGSSVLWALGAGAVLLIACFDVYRQLRKRRDRARARYSSDVPQPQQPSSSGSAPPRPRSGRYGRRWPFWLELRIRRCPCPIRARRGGEPRSTTGAKASSRFPRGPRFRCSAR